MKITKTLAAFGLALGLTAAGAQAVQTVTNEHLIPYDSTTLVTATTIRYDITTSKTLDPTKVYALDGVYTVRDGASLTIPAGTVIRSNGSDATDTNAPSADATLIVARGGKLYIQGTATNPVIFTSTADGTLGASGLKADLTLGGKRFTANEWGSVALLGRARIGALTGPKGGAALEWQDGVGAAIHTNTGILGELQLNEIEGFYNQDDTDGSDADSTPDDPRGLYGGTDDNDSSGSVKYVSLRYGGRFGPTANAELNGMSFGGVGRGTEVEGVDIWCNIDDGIETYGGTVNYKKLSLWNIGDDSFDVDQGWRGKAQFGLIVQGGTDSLSSGSGRSDNCFEIDGGEPSWVQPLTTACIYNFTVVGAPNTGDALFVFRDGARVQFRNIVAVDIDDQLLKEEQSEGSGATDWRYPDTEPTFGGPAIVDWADMWQEPYTLVHDATDARTGAHPFVAAAFQDQAVLEGVYAAQSAGYPEIHQGYMAEITNCVFHNIVGGADKAATISPAGLGALATGTPVSYVNPAFGNVLEAAHPLESITRISRTVGLGTIDEVTALDPRPNTSSAAAYTALTAPADGFFTPAPFVGAFSRSNVWVNGWTAAAQYGILAGPSAADPSTSAALATTLNFATVNGTFYLIEGSTDGGTTWTPETVVEGDGTTKSVGGSLGAGFSTSKLYRVTAL